MNSIICCANLVFNFPNHLRARISNMFSPYLVDGENLNFEVGLTAVKNLHSGNAMEVLKTWLNGWHASSRCQATQFYPCLFGCHGARDDLHHYIICPQLYSLCKYLCRDLSQYPLDSFGLYSPGHELMVHLCCAYGAYHTLINYVKSNHELSASKLMGRH